MRTNFDSTVPRLTEFIRCVRKPNIELSTHRLEQHGFGAVFAFDQKPKVLKSIYKKKSFLMDDFISCSTTQVENVLESTGKNQ